jgi:hypothetical protein
MAEENNENHDQAWTKGEIQEIKPGAFWYWLSVAATSVVFFFLWLMTSGFYGSVVSVFLVLYVPVMFVISVAVCSFGVRLFNRSHRIVKLILVLADAVLVSVASYFLTLAIFNVILRWV